MLLRYFTEEAYDKLRDNIESNLEHYMNDEEWLEGFFQGDSEFYKTSSVDVNHFHPSYTPGNKSDEQKTMEDLINTRLLYDSFKTLTPLQASNKYMWTYLCHADPEYRKYIIDRWTPETKNTVDARFFAQTADNIRNDNALSRLWWYGYLTYDSSNTSNPYALTEVLLTNQTICTDIMDTLNRSNFNRMKGVLIGLKRFIDDKGDTKGVIDYMRECNKYLNRYAAVTKMEFLEAEEIGELVFKNLMGQVDKKK